MNFELEKEEMYKWFIESMITDCVMLTIYGKIPLKMTTMTVVFEIFILNVAILITKMKLPFKKSASRSLLILTQFKIPISPENMIEIKKQAKVLYIYLSLFAFAMFNQTMSSRSWARFIYKLFKKQSSSSNSPFINLVSSSFNKTASPDCSINFLYLSDKIPLL